VGAETSARHESIVWAVQLYIEANLDAPLNLTALARVSGFSPHHFQRVFLHVTGETPKNYLRRIRLERAVLRLKVSPDAVLAIALEAGFGTNETFTRAFTAQFGIRPSEFRDVLRRFRAAVDDTMVSREFPGFTPETPLTLRFDMTRGPVSVVTTPARHLLFARHRGFEHVLDGRSGLSALWDDVIVHATERTIRWSPSRLVAVAHDDPYVTDERHIRFDACLEIEGPVTSQYPFGYRHQPAGLAVVRRHHGGLEEVAKTFAYLGVNWLPSPGHGLGAAAPFEVHHCSPQPDGTIHIDVTESFVPLQSLTQQEAP